LEKLRALAPGMKYRHYAPDIPMFLVESSSYDDYKLSLLTDNILKLAKDLSRSYKIVTIAATRETIDIYEREFRNNPNIKIIDIGSRKNLYEIAKNIFDVLRKADKDSVLIVEGVEEKSLGLAIMNRLRKASSKRIVI
jgi:L-threonylcarbamoyladenylate synthase